MSLKKGQHPGLVPNMKSICKGETDVIPKKDWFLCGGVLVAIDVDCGCWWGEGCGGEGAFGHGAQGLDLWGIVLHGVCMRFLAGWRLTRERFCSRCKSR